MVEHQVKREEKLVKREEVHSWRVWLLHAASQYEVPVMHFCPIAFIGQSMQFFFRLRSYYLLVSVATLST